MKGQGVTVVVHVDGDLGSRQYRWPLWAFEAGKWGAIVVGVLVVLFFTFAGPITRNAVKVPGLRREITRLEQENSRVQQLAAALNRAEQNYQELRAILGARAPQRGSAAGRTTLDPMRAVPVRARTKQPQYNGARDAVGGCPTSRGSQILTGSAASCRRRDG